MIKKCVIRRGQYHDSGVLMRVSSRLSEKLGVRQAAVMMGTDNNKEILRDIGLLGETANNATASDMIIAIEADSEDIAEKAILEMDKMLAEVQKVAARVGAGETYYKTFSSALDAMPDANFAIISVPGEFAAREARKALEAGLNVLLFSDHVSIEDERDLKLLAREKRLLMMGPGCGTAIFNNVGLAFSNQVRKGPIGVVAVAGTGLQEVAVQVHKLGSGISQGIGTGGTDLSEKIGGIMMLEGIKRLQKDENTEVIVLISKQSSGKVATQIQEAIRASQKPVVLNFVGESLIGFDKTKIIPASTLEEAAIKAVALAKGGRPLGKLPSEKLEKLKSNANKEFSKFKADEKYLRGLFSGGTLCKEAIFVAGRYLKNIHSNIPKSELKLKNSNLSEGHTCVDLGEEEFTQGRPHPMIDFQTRKQRIIQEAKDNQTAVILLDVVLGYGSHPNPAEELCPTIREAKKIADVDGRYLSVVAYICGTDQDFQKIAEQEIKITKAGAITLPSNAQAAMAAALIAGKIKNL